MKKIAIACQGGGSHTAFTAGALKRILKENKKSYDIAAISGTSGGAICALLTWYGLLTGGNARAAKLLDSFWKDISANTLGDMFLNEWFVGTSRMQNEGYAIPQISPYMYPPFAQEYLRTLLEKHVDFEKIKKFTNPQPELLVGAVDIQSGEFNVFKNCTITSDVILASAAIPAFLRAVPVDKYLFSWNKIPGDDNETLMEFLKQDFNIEWTENAKIEKIDNGNIIRVYKGTKSLFLELNDKKTIVCLKIDKNKTYEFIVKMENEELNIIKKSDYWDGLFSQNPPVRDFISGIDVKPDEIWVIQINPRTNKKLPESTEAIAHRRNELSGNLSLYQELFFIEKVNEWIEKGYFNESKTDYKIIRVGFIKMLRDLELESKLDRRPEFIEEMKAYGEKQAGEFLGQPAKHHYERLRNLVVQ
jgi:predicted acylesterase/phospholipase RssA